MTMRSMIQSGREAISNDETETMPMLSGLAGEAANLAIPAATVVPVRVTAVTVQDAVQAARMVLTA